MTKAMAKKILVADDDASIRLVLTQALQRAGYQVEATDNGATLFRWVAEGRGDMVITDVMMPGENGLDLIPKIHKRRPGMKVIVISAQNALTTAVAASEKGALDYLPKPFDVDDLLSMVHSALRDSGAQRSRAQDNQGVAAVLDKSFVTGHSRAMQEIYRTIARLRGSNLTVLISGESGTGKEVIARALHQYSDFAKGPFVAVNMAAIPRELIESELFGHEKGAFTGATQKTIGRFEQAAGGTLFLDEIGDMPYEAQTRLLRVLQEGEFSAVGGRRTIKAGVRIVAATNKDLRALVVAGRFREDLFYRLNVVPLHVPPLRARAEDIPALVTHFTGGGVKVFEPAAMRRLQEYPWPGNIRELENFIRRLAALHAQDVVDEASVLRELAQNAPASAALPASAAGSDMLAAAVTAYFETSGARLPEGRVYDEVVGLVEKPLIEHVLRLTRGNQIRAAEILGLNRNTLRTRIRTLGIDVRKQA